MAQFLQTKKGYWVADRPLSFMLREGIDDAESFGELLKKYLKLKGLPFKVERSYLQFSQREADENLEAFWRRGYLVMHVREKSLISKLNPWHNELEGDETIVIEWVTGSKEIIAYQEFKDNGLTVTWKLPLEQIKEFRELLEHFSQADNVYKLLIECT